jgi:WD40 repeat protein
MITGRRAYPRWLFRALVVFAIGMTAFASIASREHHSTEDQRNAATSRYVQLEARDLQRSDPSLAMQLALVAYGLSHTTEARSTLVDLTAGELPTRLLGPTGRTLLALGDDGHRLAIAHQGDNSVGIYGLRYSQLTELTTVPGGAGAALVDAVAVSDSGRLLAVGNSAGRVALWSLSSVAQPKRLAVLHAGSGAVTGLGFSPRGSSLAAADADGAVQRWSLADAAQPALAAALVAPGRPALEAVSYSHNGSTLAAVGAHGALDVWPAHGGRTPLADDTLGTATLTAVSYGPDGQTLTVGGDSGSVWVSKLDSDGRPAAATTPLQAGASVTALAFSRDGRYLTAATSARSTPIWSVASRQLVASLPHPAMVSGVAFTDGDRHLLSADTAGTARIWQFPAPSTYTFASAIAALSYSPTRPRLAVTLRSGRTDEWDVVNEWRAAPVGAWYAAPPSTAPPQSYWLTPSSVITRTTTSPTGTVTSGTTTVASGTSTIGTRFLVLNPRAGYLALQRTRAQVKVTSSLLSPNDEFFAAAAANDQIWLWNVADPSRPVLVAKLAGFTAAVTSMVFSNSSQTLFASSADHTVRIWGLSMQTSRLQLPSSPLLGPSTAITRLALSPDGRTLAAATAGGRVWMWSVSNPSKASLSGSLTAAGGKLTSLSFSPSDSVLVAGGANRRLTFWHYRPYQAVNRLCALAGTAITPYEWSLYVPGTAYKPPCAKWTAPVPRTVTVTTPSP